MQNHNNFKNFGLICDIGGGQIFGPPPPPNLIPKYAPEKIFEITEFLDYFVLQDGTNPTKFPKLGKFKRFNCSLNINTFMMIGYMMVYNWLVSGDRISGRCEADI